MKRAYSRASLIKICIICCLLFSSFETFGQAISYRYKGSWSAWITLEVEGIYPYFSWDLIELSKYTDDSGCSLKKNGVTYFDFYVTNYQAPSKKEIKQHRKTNTSFEYTGTVTYYVSDEYPTAEDLAKHNKLVQPDPRTDTTPTVKRKTTAKIRIQPYKKYPQCYNIFFDNIGVAIDISGLKFKRK